jgi:Leucine-rich repeat (LRR) protein
MDIASIRLLTNDFIVRNSYNLLNRPRNLKYSFVTEYLKECRSYKRNTLFNDQSIVPLSLSILDTNWQLKVTSICLDNQNLFKLNSMGSLVNLRWASFNDNFLTSIDGLECCTKLEEISFENNFLSNFSGLEELKNLRKLNLSQNNIEIDHRNVDCISIHLPRLTYLSLTHNRIKNLKFAHKLPALIELYVNFNELSNLREIYNLKQNTSLVILDLWCNPMCKDSKYRLFVIYHLKYLKALDGYPVEQVECVEARELLGGKLTWDLIAEKCANLDSKNSLNLCENCLKVIDLVEYQLVPQQFLNIVSLNLENNYLTSFSGLCYLRNLKSLCLNNNKIETLFPKLKSGSQASTQAIQEPQRILESLEALYLDFNGITDLLPLQLGKLPSLTLLSLRGNELIKIEGLENAISLRQLILDKNKIKTVTETSFIGLSNNLVELHIEENRLKDLNNFYNLKHIEHLYAANNKINDVNDIERLQYLAKLNILSLINNPVGFLL